MINTAEQKRDFSPTLDTALPSFFSLVLLPPELPLEQQEPQPSLPTPISTACEKLRHLLTQQTKLSPERKAAVIAHLNDAMFQKQEKKRAAATMTEVPFVPTRFHFNIIPASLEWLLLSLEKFQRTEVPTDFFCEVIDDEGFPVKQGEIAYPSAIKLIQIINENCSEFCKATLTVADIQLNGHITIPQVQSHYRLKITIN